MPSLYQNTVFAGHYLLKELVGRGGFSEVWKTEDTMADGVVEAIKIYAPESGMDEVGIKQFKNEYITIRSLDHSNLIQVYRFDIFNGIPFLVMPYMERGSLSKLLYEKGAFSEYDLAVLLQQVGSGLNYLHTRQPKVLHQDIKPDNILVTTDGNYKLTDFGISSRTRNTLRKVTGHKQALALAYAPPERFAARPINNEAGDIFSLGVTIYELCTGEVPWMGNGGLSLLQGAEVPDLPPQYSRILNNIIKGCLALEWEKRPTAMQLVEEANYFIENNSWRPYGQFAPNTPVSSANYRLKQKLKPVLITATIACVIMAALVYPELNMQLGSVKDTIAKPVKKSTIPKIGKTSEAAVHNSASSDDQPKEQLVKKEETKSSEAPAGKVSKTVNTGVPKTKEKKALSTASPNVANQKSLTADTYKPETLGDFLSAIKNKNNPIAARKGWSTEVNKMFSANALIIEEIGGTQINEYKPQQFLDLLLEKGDIKSLRIIKREDNNLGKVQKLYVQIE
ncbi:serine/threonine-protein kinase [Pontibacter aydingkolensis]|uniref:Serine/threonine protein kinase n=1 Tax=Pontibacter aydingkolensis TaxID=1911536 RepID=A0ABS7CSP0_9BACT|nr:serine/threonine-protein kinase [Pontibacter aydingkolensis]MBW7466851.1 serine/threonine protein kinase [Pontibacter aydingkolensis]